MPTLQMCLKIIDFLGAGSFATPSYLKDLEKIPKKDQQRIRETIAQLSQNPRPEGCKRLQGQKEPPLYRVRCGDYRIIYTIHDYILLVLVIAVGHRKEIYREY